MPRACRPAARTKRANRLGPLLGLALGATLALGVPGAARAQVQLANPGNDPVVARVDSAPVHMSEIAEFARQLPAQVQQMPPQVLFPMLIEQVIAQRVLLDAARKANLQDSEEVRRRVARAEAEAMQSAYLSRELDQIITEQAIRARYERDIANRPAAAEVRASHILLATESDARAVITALAGGGDFAQLARERSRDPAGRNGGDLGFFKREDMVAEFAEAAFGMQPGQTSAAPVRTQFGWHVIRVAERREMPKPSFDDAREGLMRAMSEEAIEQVIGRLRAAARIERVAPEGGGAAPRGAPIPVPAPAPAPAPAR